MVNLWYNRGNVLMHGDASNIPCVSHKGELMTTSDDTTNPPLKRCVKCAREFPATREFFHGGSGKYGLKNECRSCRAGKELPPRDLCLAPDGHKKCPYCNEIKPLDVIHFQQRKNGKFNRICRKCHNRKTAENYKKDRERIIARTVEYHRKNADKTRVTQKKYHKNHPEKNRAAGHRRRAKERGLPRQWSPADVKRMMGYWNHTCCVCGRQAGFWNIICEEHWIAIDDPRPDNPGTVPWNMLPMCHAKPGSNGQGACNNSKGNKDPIEWLKEYLGEKKAAEVLNHVLEYFEQVRR